MPWGGAVGNYVGLKVSSAKTSDAGIGNDTSRTKGGRMKRLLKWIPWWLPLCFYGGKSVQAEDVKWFPQGEIGFGFSITDQRVVTAATLVGAEFYNLVQLRFGVEAAENRTALADGVGLKLKEVVERLGGTWMLEKNLALTALYS